MRYVLSLIVARLFCCGACVGAATPAPLVSQLHVVSVHVKDHATFDAVFLWFRDVIKLPLIYGELTKPTDQGKTCYAGFSVGNCYIEPCGPYRSDPGFSPDQPARFHGLTFTCGVPIADAAVELGRRTIAHSDLIQGWGPSFIYVTDGLLTGRRQAVSLWEIQDPNDHANLNFVASSLRQAQGGPLGVKRISEIRIRYPAQENLAQWQSFLSPAGHKADTWTVGNGPVLRFVPGQENEIESIVLEVESLEKAAAAMSKAGLHASRTGDVIELDSSGIFGLRIRLEQVGERMRR
jgi:hypothetical protein